MTDEVPADFEQRYGFIHPDHSGVDLTRLRRHHQDVVRRLRDDASAAASSRPRTSTCKRTIDRDLGHLVRRRRARSTASSATASTSARTIPTVADPADPPAAPADPPVAPAWNHGPRQARRRRPSRPRPSHPTRPPPSTATRQTSPPCAARPPAYRTRLRETETERDQLRARVERHERADVERLAEARRLRPTSRHVHVRRPTSSSSAPTAASSTPPAYSELAQRVLTERPGLRKPGLDFGRGSRLDGGQAREPGLYDLLPQNRDDDELPPRPRTRPDHAPPDPAPQRPERPAWVRRSTPAAAAWSPTRTTRQPRATSSPAGPNRPRTTIRPTRRSAPDSPSRPPTRASATRSSSTPRPRAAAIDRYEWLGIPGDITATGITVPAHRRHRRALGRDPHRDRPRRPAPGGQYVDVAEP